MHTRSENVALSSVRCFVAYDSHSGEVLYVHEFMAEAGQCNVQDSVWDPETIRQAAERDFGTRALKVLCVPRGLEPKDGYVYRVDIKSQRLTEVERPVKRFRDFLREKSKRK